MTRAQPVAEGRPSLSVALCTCNGERYLPAQLESLLAGTRLPDELVVCEDASDDNSLALLEDFAARAPFPVRIQRNPSRLGVGANFEQVIRLCRSDVILLCDQDDVWFPTKLERFAAVFADLPEVGWVFCDAEVVDARLDPLGYTLWGRVGFNRSERSRAAEGSALTVLLKHYVVAGAAMAFRADLKPCLLPIPSDWPYDAWMAVVLAGVSRCVLIDQPLQRYRQHDANLVGGRGKSLARQIRDAMRVERGRYYEEELARWRELASRLEAVQAPAAAREAVCAKLAHLERRATLPRGRLLRLPGVAAEWASGGYRRYARNWGSVALDLLLR